MGSKKKTTKPIAVLDTGARRRLIQVVRQLRRAPLTSRDKVAIARDLRVNWHNYTPAMQRAIGAQWAGIAQRAKDDS